MAEISVIVPVYKVEKYLRKCIDSILEQSFSDFELILVDDGSPDNCPSICDEYSYKDNRIHVIHQNNMGLSGARNSGIEWAIHNSSSNWISFIDSDDWIDLDYLKTLYYICHDLNCDIASCQYMQVTDDQEIIEMSIDTDNIKFITGIEAQTLKHSVLPVTAWGKLYKKSLFQSIRFPVGRQHEDRFTTWKLFLNCSKIGLSDIQLYYYLSRKDSIMGRPFDNRRLDDYYARIEKIDFFRVNKKYNIDLLPLSLSDEYELSSLLENQLKIGSSKGLIRDIKKVYRKLVWTCYELWPRKFWVERMIYSFSPPLLQKLYNIRHIFDN